MTTKLALFGCGVIGQRRVENLPNNAKLVACYDTDSLRTRAVATKYGASACASIEEVHALKPDAAIIASVNSALGSLAQKCLEAGIHVLVEKPAARGFGELAQIKNPHKCIFKVGFNHRFHPAYRDIIAELKNRPQDPIMYIRARYGNGARVGFEKEWRASPEIAGGGELLDQGVHVIDLARNLLGDLTVQTSWVRTHFWKMPVDDNAWVVCSGPNGETFQFHVSSSEWKNEFAFEVYTRERKYQWSGLGRSYGPETLTIYKMKPEMGPPDVEKREYPSEDKSWLEENTNFIDAISHTSAAWGTSQDALACLKVVQSIYEFSEKTQSRASWPQPQYWKPAT